MRAIAAFIMRGRLQAIIVAAGLALLGGLFPPGWLLSGGVVGPTPVLSDRDRCSSASFSS